MAKIVFKFSGWRSPNLDPPIHTFTCPICRIQFRPQNVMCIACPNCFFAGNKQTFSTVLKEAA